MHAETISFPILFLQFVEGVGLGIVIYALARKLGKPVKDAMEADIEAFRTALYDHRDKEVQSLEQAIKEELDMEDVLACRHEIFKIKHVRKIMYQYNHVKINVKKNRQ